MKTLTITLSKIIYRGESVGRDVRIETSISEKDSIINKRIPHGSSISLAHVIATIQTDDLVFRSDLSLIITERDFLWSDQGQGTVTIEIDTRSPRIREQTIDVLVRERRSLFGLLLGKTKTANFEITLSMETSEATHMVARTGDGWLEVVPEWQTETVWLPEFLRVRLLKQEKGRDHLKILEGSYTGKRASVKTLFEPSKLSVIQNEPPAPPIEAEYSISKRTLTLRGTRYKAKDYEGEPWQEGVYPIYIPDYPHQGGLNYSEYPHARTWFLVGFESERYIHVGLVSRGCITISAEQDWEGLYNMLIRARAGDGESIGTLKVIN